IVLIRPISHRGPSRAVAEAVGKDDLLFVTTSPSSLQPGQSLGSYRIESFVAAGGMGRGLPRDRYPPESRSRNQSELAGLPHAELHVREVPCARHDGRTKRS